MINNKKILFIAPLPAPVNGQSKASYETLVAMRDKGFSVHVINSNRRQLKKSFFSEIIRFIDILNIYRKIFFSPKGVDIIYFSLSESFAGNLKDLIIFIILRKKLNIMILHMLGGTGMLKIINNSGIISRFNGYFMKKMKYVIVEGDSGVKIFSSFFDIDKIKIVPNFVENYLNVTKKEIDEKYSSLDTIKVLYLSNLLSGKGYEELLDAYILLPSHIKSHFLLQFVGGFSNLSSKQFFLNKIENLSGVEYLGEFIDGLEKRNLYLNSHIFCLPTYYPFEGQPISILESYATGCVVITTPHAGILDIFTDKLNGYLVRPQSPHDICEIFKKILYEKNSLKKIAIRNSEEALTKYKSSLYRQNIISILD